MTNPDRSEALVDRTKIRTDEGTIPLFEEQLAVTVHARNTGVVRLEKHNEKRVETVEVPLTAVTWNVEHVAVNRVVESTPEVRQEGDTTIYPVMEERLIVTRQLVLREEVHVTRTATTTSNVSTHVLLHEVLEASREEDASLQ